MPPATTETLLLPSGDKNVHVFPESCESIKHRKSAPTVDENENYSIPKYDKIDDWRGEIRWPDLIVQIFLHAGAVYGIYLLFYVKFVTILWGELIQ